MGGFLVISAWILGTFVITMIDFLYWKHFVPQSKKSIWYDKDINSWDNYVTQDRFAITGITASIWPFALPIILPCFVFYKVTDLVFRKIANRLNSKE